MKLGLCFKWDEFIHLVETLHLCRYARSSPNSILNSVPYNLPNIQPSFAQYDPTFNQMGHMSQSRASVGFVPHTNHVMSPFATGVNQSSGNAAYLQWPSAAMMYAHTYDQFRHAVYQVSQRCFC